MVKGMKYRAVSAALTREGCEHIRTRGSHQIWTCPCGKHRVSIAPHKGEVSPGLVRDVIKQMTCLPKGWLA